MVNPAAYNQTFKIKEPVDGASNAIGVFLIIYGILRALWALFFTAIGAGAFIWNPVALVYLRICSWWKSNDSWIQEWNIHLFGNTCDFWSVEFNLPSQYLGRPNCDISSYDRRPNVVDVNDVFNYFHRNCCLASTLSLRSAERRLS